MYQQECNEKQLSFRPVDIFGYESDEYYSLSRDVLYEEEKIILEGDEFVQNMKRKRNIYM